MNNDVSMITVKVDALGRITVPVKVRRMLGIECEEYVYMSTNGRELKIFKLDKNELANHINYVMETASDSEDITINEYRQLCEIMSKLRGEVE